MPEFLLFMHADAPTPVNESAWSTYLGLLTSSGVLRGGSAIGSGICVRK